MLVWVLAALAVIVPLAGYAIYLLWRLRQQQQRQAQQQAQWQALAQERQSGARHHVEVILRALLDQQVSLCEASLRVRGLYDVMQPSLEEAKTLDLLVTLAQRIEHIPTHEAWKALESKQRRQFEREMRALENEFTEPTKQAIHQLLQHWQSPGDAPISSHTQMWEPPVSR